jgi:5-methylthioribose kinase
MAYRALSEKTLVDYLRGRPAVAERLPRTADLTVREVGDGNLNLVFIVSSSAEPARAVIVKQALDYLRVAGESWPLTRERMRFETQAMLLYNQLCPGLVPEIYDHDEEMSLLVMEYLGAHEIMRKALVQRRRFPKFVDHISTFLVNSLFCTSDYFLPGVQKKEMQARFINPHLNKLQEDFVYTNPYISSPENKWNPLIDAEVSALRGNAEVKRHIAQMKAHYMTHAEALIHADLHTGSIMLNENDTRVIDPEFCYFGPMAYDVGAVLQNLVLNCLSHFGHTQDQARREEYQEYVLGLVRGVWNGFARKLDALWQEKPSGDLMPRRYWESAGGAEAFAEFRSATIARLLRETAGHGGTKFLRRMMGIVNVWDIESISDPRVRAVAEKTAIRIGVRWLVDRARVTSIEDLLRVVKEELAWATGQKEVSS